MGCVDCVVLYYCFVALWLLLGYVVGLVVLLFGLFGVYYGGFAGSGASCCGCCVVCVVLFVLCGVGYSLVMVFRAIMLVCLFVVFWLAGVG